MVSGALLDYKSNEAGSYYVRGVNALGAVVMYPDQPGAGTHTYTIGIQHQQGSNCTCTDSSILAIIQKR